MAVFFTNICKFSGCNQQFASLSDLILHIEDTHILSENEFLKRQENQQPPCVPLSYIYRVFPRNSGRRPKPIAPEPEPVVASTSRKRPAAGLPLPIHIPSTPSAAGFQARSGHTQLKHQHSILSSAVSTTTNDDRMSPASSDKSLSSTDSQTLDDGNLEASLLRAKLGAHAIPNDAVYPCPVQGCKQRFKTKANLTSHSKAVHSQTFPHPQPKQYKCTHGTCSKSYKTAAGLANHMSNAHSAGNTPIKPTLTTIARALPVTLLSSSPYVALGASRARSTASTGSSAPSSRHVSPASTPVPQNVVHVAASPANLISLVPVTTAAAARSRMQQPNRSATHVRIPGPMVPHLPGAAAGGVSGAALHAHSTGS